MRCWGQLDLEAPVVLLGGSVGRVVGTYDKADVHALIRRSV